MNANEPRYLAIGVVLSLFALVVAGTIFLGGGSATSHEYDAQHDRDVLRANLLAELEQVHGVSASDFSNEASPWALYSEFGEIELHAYDEVLGEINGDDVIIYDIALPGVFEYETWEEAERMLGAGRLVLQRIRERGGFELLAQAAQSRPFVEELEAELVGPLTTAPYSVLRSGQDYLLSVAHIALEEGDEAEFLSTVDGLVGVLRSMSWSSTALKRAAYQVALVRLIEAVATQIGSHHVSADACQKLLRCLDSIQPCTIEFVIRGEANTSKATVAQFARGESLELSPYRDLVRAPQASRWAHLIADRSDESAALPSRFRAIEPIERLRLLESEWVARIETPIAERTDRGLLVLAAEAWVAEEEELTADDLVWQYELIMHDLFATAERIQTSFQGERLALMIEIYHGEHGRYPDDLAELAKEQGTAVPHDPMHGQPYVYRQVGSSYDLYAVGLDGIDNGGAFAEELNLSKSTLDLINPPSGTDLCIIAAQRYTESE